MAEKRNPLGPTGETVRANITRRRERLNLSYAELSRRLDAIGRPIPVLGLGRIERGERRVDADDLTALAVALEVSPTTLLMPSHLTPADNVEFTGGRAPAMHAWEWLRAETPYPLDRHGEDVNVSVARFQADNWPGWFLENERIIEEARRARHIRAAFAWAEDEAAGKRVAADGDD
ncbi:helix-turn-helix domain-containing protein [Nocardia farcinica]|uniref:helix-turn-helix domain-containing protein n=1 Tax=Nocardia farcinica TaxID=37329 RepID=UPI0024566987|nr:helix-turn-helix transcriptional regulator [Nocardia farcinica]